MKFPFHLSISTCKISTLLMGFESHHLILGETSEQTFHFFALLPLRVRSYSWFPGISATFAIYGPLDNTTAFPFSIYALDWSNGFRIDGPGSGFGSFVVGGYDFNADMYVDIVISAPSLNSLIVVFGSGSWNDTDVSAPNASTHLSIITNPGIQIYTSVII